MINQVLNFFVGMFNHLPHVHLAEVHTSWLESPQFALFFCLLPIIWAGHGTGLFDLFRGVEDRAR